MSQVKAVTNSGYNLKLKFSGKLLLKLPQKSKVAQIKWWNRELTQGEITQNYNAMKSRFNL